MLLNAGTKIFTNDKQIKLFMPLSGILIMLYQSQE